MQGNPRTTAPLVRVCASVKKDELSCHARLTIVQEVQELHLRITVCIGSGVLLAIVRIERSRKIQVPKFVEVEELGVSEQGEFGVDVERVLLLLLLHSLVIRRRNRVQRIEVLREVGRSSPIVAGHLWQFRVDFRPLQLAESGQVRWN